MRVNSYTMAKDGSDYYRVKLPARALQEQGMDVEYLETGGNTRDADVLVFNRPANKIAVEVIAKLSMDGYAIVVDVDDLFSHVRVGHSAYGETASQAHDYLKWACKFATLVTATTPLIADEYGGEKGRVIPNYVPKRYLDIVPPESTAELPRVGWSGTVSSHPNDLQVVGDAIKRLESAKACTVGYVGPKEESGKVRSALGLYRKPSATGWLPLEFYPEALAQLDVGIVPLEDCLFNDAKSWLKGLEMAAVGVPFVASPTVEYRSLFKLGAGTIASRPNEWRRSVAELFSPSYEEEAIGRGKEAARRLTIEGNVERWADVFTEAYSLRPANAVLS